MSKAMLVHCTPFDRKVVIYVLDNDNPQTAEAIPVEADKMIDTIYDAAKKYDCHTLNIKGAKIYTRGIEKKIKDAGITKYSDTDLRIKLVK